MKFEITGTLVHDEIGNLVASCTSEGAAKAALRLLTTPRRCQDCGAIGCTGDEIDRFYDALEWREANGGQ